MRITMLMRLVLFMALATLCVPLGWALEWLQPTDTKESNHD